MIRKTVLLSILICLLVTGHLARAAAGGSQVSASIQATATVVPVVGVLAVDFDGSSFKTSDQSDTKPSHLFYLYHPHVTAVQLTLETDEKLVAEFSMATAGHDRQSPAEILQSLPYQSLVAAEHEGCAGDDTCHLIVTIIYTEN